MKSVLLALLFSAFAFAQEGITVVATKNVEFAPEEVTFSVMVLTDQESSLDDVLKVAKDTGLEAKHLVSISTQPQYYGPGPAPQVRSAYQFVMPVKFAAMKETSDKFAALRRSLLADNSKVEVQIVGTSIGASIATQEKARQDALPDLLAEARRKADALAKVAGLKVGRIVAMTDPYVGIPYGAATSPGYYYSGPSVLRSTIALTVRFALE